MKRKFLLIFIFLGMLILTEEVKADLSEYNINRWVDIIYKYCKNCDQVAADCQECTNYPGDEICESGIRLENLHTQNVIKCRYVTNNINKETIKKYLRKIDERYGRNLGQRKGSELLICIDYKNDKVLKLSRAEQYYFGGYNLYDYYSGQKGGVIDIVLGWLNNHDLPNWITLLIALVFWPLILALISKRTYSSILGLEISLGFGKGSVGEQSCPYLDIIFYNNTGKVVYLTQLKASNIKSRLEVNKNAKPSMDIVSRRYDLKFLNDKGQYIYRHVTLNTGQSMKTGLPLSNKYEGDLGNELLEKLTSHRRSLWITKFFNLEYTALVGDKKYKVIFKY